MGRFKSSLNAMTQVKRLCSLGGMPPPLWLEPWLKTEAVMQKLPRKKKPQRIEFPEDRLVKGFMAKNPQVKDIPVDLGSFEPHVARRFAWLQLKEMEAGLSQDEAYEKAMEHLLAAGVNLHPPKRSILNTLQQQEETALVQALERRLAGAGEK